MTAHQAAAMWRELEGLRKAKRIPLTAEERALAHAALDRMLDSDSHHTLWLLTRSRVAVEALAEQEAP